MATARNELLAECACFDLRKATRAVSRMYDDFLRDVGVNITQFSQLRPIRAEKEISVSTLGRVGITSTHHRGKPPHAVTPLRACHERPRSRPAEQRDELAAL
jgi:hypothetical protein